MYMFTITRASLKANSHRHARHDKTVMAASLRFGGVNWIPDNKTVADRKCEV